MNGEDVGPVSKDTVPVLCDEAIADRFREVMFPGAGVTCLSV